MIKVRNFVLLLLLIAFAVTPVFAQSNDAESPYVKAEQMPSFQNGDLFTFRNWVMSRILYPKVAQEKSISGRVLVSFVIEKDGSLSSINVIDTPHASLSDEVVRVLKTSPKWQPGMQGNRVVRVKYTLPVEFRLQEVEVRLAVGERIMCGNVPAVTVGFFDSEHKHGLLISAECVYGDWATVNDWCKKLGEGWRLPEADELKYILERVKSNDKIPTKHFKTLYKSLCWVNSDPNSDSAEYVDMNTGTVGRESKKKKKTAFAVAIF
ncbi:MAG: TonB family protein [Alistipes sp.]|nr:TonB family protein [Alistipes sp.]